MTKHSRTDGNNEVAPVTAVAPLRAALVDIPSACTYLGNLSRAKFYADILSELDVVKLGARTMVTIASLDRLIAAHRQPQQ